jgi:hypothetical protein
MGGQQKQHFLLAVTLLFAALPAPAIAQGTTTVVALSELGGTGTIQRVYDAPDINDSGQVAYYAYRRDLGLSVFLKDATTNIELIEYGDPAPDGNGIFLGGANDPRVNSEGRVAFRGVLTQTIGGSNDNLGIFTAHESGSAQIAREGGSVPDNAYTFANFVSPELNNYGHVAFEALLREQPFGRGIYAFDGATLREVARFNQLRPDGMGAHSYFGGVKINDLGRIAFRSNGVTVEGPFRSLFLDSSGMLTEIAHQGQPAPGENLTIQYLNGFALNNHGDIVFQASVTDDGGTTTDEAIYVRTNSNIVPIVREGDAIPIGLGSFTDISLNPSLNAYGETVFWARFTDDSVQHTGLFIGSADEVVEITRDGQPAPDGAASIGRFFSAVTEINGEGQFAFAAWNNNSPTADDTAVYFYDGSGLQLIKRVGQPLAGSTLADISSLSSGVLLNMNARGQVVFNFELTDDRTGILLFTPNTPGDFNLDGAVDAADYVVWRKGLGTTYTQNDYIVWRSHFGQTAGSGADQASSSAAAIPEPATGLLTLIVAVSFASRRRRSALSSSATST